MSDYRFKVPQLRAWNKTTKKMHYSNASSTGFILGASGFSVVEIDSANFNVEGVLADDSDSVLMSGVGYRDKTNADIYEGDVVFMLRPLKRAKLPIAGIVQAKDFTYSVNSGVNHFAFDYRDADIQVLGNIFENTDEELAAKVEALMKEHAPKV